MRGILTDVAAESGVSGNVNPEWHATTRMIHSWEGAKSCKLGCLALLRNKEDHRQADWESNGVSWSVRSFRGDRVFGGLERSRHRAGRAGICGRCPQILNAF